MRLTLPNLLNRFDKLHELHIEQHNTTLPKLRLL
jgi:uncharacterized protein YqfB (UPF0267 family)